MSASLFLFVFFLYVGGMIVFSLWLSRKQRSGEDFLLGNRSVPFILMLGTTVATMVGTGSSMGAIGKGYSDGWAGSLYGIGGAVGILLLAKMFASARKHQFMTFAEEMSFYYGANKKIKAIVAVLVLLASVGWLGAHILGGGLYISWITGIDLMAAKVLVALGFGVYVLIGGYMAVVWTDSIQAVVLFAGFILMAVLSIEHAGGLSELQASFGSQPFHFLEGTELIPSISLAFVIFVGVMATPAYRQRIYSSDNIPTIRKSFYLSGALYLAFSIIPAIIGMAAFNLNPSLDNSNFAFPFMATEVLPAAIGLVVLIAGLSATMSSASSDAIAGVAILLRDVFILVFGKMPQKERTVKYSRWGVFGIVGLALVFSLYATDVIDYIKYMIAIIMSGLFVCVLLGKYWPRVTWQGGVATLAGGAVCSLLIISIPTWNAYWGNPAIPAVAVAFICGLAVSLITPESQISDDEAAEILRRERDIMEMGDEG
ncbi:MAG: sodium:solute symporter family protein [Saprospiraceae bacterium]|nr:sodium:solute symporter family protein [Saprospiraceae bacterium]